MIKRILAVAVLAVGIFGLTLYGVGEVSGEFSFWSEFDPLVGQFDELDTGLNLTYTLGDVAFGSDSVVVLPVIWVWHGFQATWSRGGLDFEANLLFGGSTAEYLYSEWILDLVFSGVLVEIHGGWLGDAVLGGPADGWAIRASGTVGPFDITSVTEFGAHIEDDGFAGITIVHALTGLERHYSTDPRALGGGGFTGQKVTIGLFDFCCADRTEADLYITSAGFGHASFSATDITTPKLPWLSLDAELVFQLETKTLAIEPSLELGDTACFTLYGALGLTSMTQISGITFPAIELVCELGPVTIRDVSLFDLNEMALSTEAYGGRVVNVADALANGWDYYPDYWEMFSIAYAGAACCEGEHTFLVNVYFDVNSTSLFDWAMTYVRADAPFGEQLRFTFAMKAGEAGAEYVAFGIDLSW